VQCVRRKVSVGSLHNTQQNFTSVPGGGVGGGGVLHTGHAPRQPLPVLPAYFYFQDTLSESKAHSLHAVQSCLYPAGHIPFITGHAPELSVSRNTRPVTRRYCRYPGHTACNKEILPVSRTHCLYQGHTACIQDTLPVSRTHCLDPGHTA
jgi:hypothetical protein